MCICFFLFSLTTRSQFNCAGLLSSMPNILPLGTTTSLALCWSSLKICQLCSACLFLTVLSQTVLLSISLKSWKGSWLFSLSDPCSSGLGTPPVYATEVQAAFSLEPTGRSLTLVTLRVSILFLVVGQLPGWRGCPPCILGVSHVNATHSFPSFFFSNSPPDPGGRGVSKPAAWLPAGVKAHHAVRV